MNTKKELENRTDKALHREFLIEGIINHKKSPWVNPSNIISLLALITSLVLGILNANLRKSNEDKSIKIHQQEAVLLDVRVNIINKINNKLKEHDSDIEQSVKSIETEQLATINKVTSSYIETSGWIFVGQLNNNGTEWKAGSPKNIKNINFSKIKKSIIEVTDEVYIREDTGKSWKSKEKILNVAYKGQQFKVLEVYKSPALHGGSFIWLKIQ